MAGVSTNISTDVTAISATELVFGNAFSCAILLNGSVQCQGSNTNCELGDASYQLLYGSQVGVPSKGFLGYPLLPERAVNLTAGSSHACALTHTSAVYCWGLSDVGQTGFLQSFRVCTPTAVPVSALNANQPTKEVYSVLL